MIFLLTQVLIWLALSACSLFAFSLSGHPRTQSSDDSELLYMRDFEKATPSLSPQQYASFGRAVALHASRKYEEASRLYRQLIEELPNNPILLHNISLLPRNVTLVCPHCGNPLRVEFNYQRKEVEGGTSTVELAVKCSACFSTFMVLGEPEGGVKIYRAEMR